MKKVLCLAAMAMVVFQYAPALAEGWLYTDATFPGDIDLQTRNFVRKGEAKCYNVLNLVEWGDCSYNAAMANGKIRQVHHDDMNVSGWIFFKKVTTNVYGE